MKKTDALAKAGAMSDGGFMAEAGAKTMQQERGGVRKEQWKDCEELRPKPKNVFHGRGSRQVSVCEMWKRKQICEDARKMYRAKVPVKESGKMEKTIFGKA